MDQLETLRYPIGRFTPPPKITPELRANWIREIEEAPQRLRDAVKGLTEEQLRTPYRPGGWTVRQLVHHIPDSHMNAYIRFKLSLTEDVPTIKPYDEAAWAELTDTDTVPLETSLDLLNAIHTRWVALLKNMGSDEFRRSYRHPEHGGRVFPLEEVLGLYAWHGRHHIAHITSLRERNGW